jgi:pSer/pThr/pTyr-binding forkhead associated (FHA) protein
MVQSFGPGQPDPPIERPHTVLETDEDLRQALLASQKGAPAPSAPEPPRTAEFPTPGPLRPGTARLFRPTARPPVPILTVFDDGKLEGELIRIRTPRFTIGRTDGDLRFPLDGRMSARHVEITHKVVDGRLGWVVIDLQSTHGLFVRVSRTNLSDNAEILVGGGRYRFEQSPPDPDAADTGETQPWSDGPGREPVRPPALTELLGREPGTRILLVQNEYWIGSDPSCPIHRPDDPFCEPRHARVYRSTKGGWLVDHNKTQNGLWLRMTQMSAESMIYFQIGEQRFRLKV